MDISNLSPIDELKIIIREEDCPFFTENELMYYLQKNNNNVNDAAYQCLIVKSQENSLSVSGLSCPDTSSYFRRLAQRYRRSNSGNLGG